MDSARRRRRTSPSQPRESWTAPAPKAQPRRPSRRPHRSPGTTPSRRDDPPPTPCRRTAPRRRESAAPAPRQAPPEPPTPQALQRYQTRTGAAEKRRRSRHGVTHAGKARKDSGEPPTPSPGTDQPPRPTADPLPSHASAHQRPPPQAKPAPETAETPTPTTAKL